MSIFVAASSWLVAVLCGSERYTITRVVETRLAGVSMEEMERRATIPVEDLLGSLPGLLEITSETRLGFSFVTVRLEGTTFRSALGRIEERLSNGRAQLPEGVWPAVEFRRESTLTYLIEDLDGAGAKQVDATAAAMADAARRVPGVVAATPLGSQSVVRHVLTDERNSSDVLRALRLRHAFVFPPDDLARLSLPGGRRLSDVADIEDIPGTLIVTPLGRRVAGVDVRIRTWRAEEAVLSAIFTAPLEMTGLLSTCEGQVDFDPPRGATLKEMAQLARAGFSAGGAPILLVDADRVRLCHGRAAETDPHAPPTERPRLLRRPGDEAVRVSISGEDLALLRATALGLASVFSASPEVSVVDVVPPSLWSDRVLLADFGAAPGVERVVVEVPVPAKDSPNAILHRAMRREVIVAVQPFAARDEENVRAAVERLVLGVVLPLGYRVEVLRRRAESEPRPPQPAEFPAALALSGTGVAASLVLLRERRRRWLGRH